MCGQLAHDSAVHNGAYLGDVQSPQSRPTNARSEPGQRPVDAGLRRRTGVAGMDDDAARGNQPSIAAWSRHDRQVTGKPGKACELLVSGHAPSVSAPAIGGRAFLSAKRHEGDGRYIPKRPGEPGHPESMTCKRLRARSGRLPTTPIRQTLAACRESHAVYLTLCDGGSTTRRAVAADRRGDLVLN